MYELGFRTPVIFSWPGRLPGGRKRDDLVSEVDLFSTLLDFAGVEAPPDRTGISLGPVLLADAEFPRETVIGSMNRLRPPRDVEAAKANPSEDLVRTERAYFLRNASWHYIWYAQRKRYGDRVSEELYRIDRDPREARNVAGEHPELAKAFREEIERWRDDVVARTKSAT
jgi:arylsulfatase A-like enzyme